MGRHRNKGAVALPDQQSRRVDRATRRRPGPQRRTPNGTELIRQHNNTETRGNSRAPWRRKKAKTSRGSCSADEGHCEPSQPGTSCGLDTTNRGGVPRTVQIQDAGPQRVARSPRYANPEADKQDAKSTHVRTFSVHGQVPTKLLPRPHHLQRHARWRSRHCCRTLQGRLRHLKASAIRDNTPNHHRWPIT